MGQPAGPKHVHPATALQFKIPFWPRAANKLVCKRTRLAIRLAAAASGCSGQPPREGGALGPKTTAGLALKAAMAYGGVIHDDKS